MPKKPAKPAKKTTTHARAFKFLFQPDMANLAFLVGVAWANDRLTPTLKKRWLAYLKDDMPKVFKGDGLTGERYEEVCKFVEEMQVWVLSSKTGPTKEMIAKAEKENAKEDWLSPISLEAWRKAAGGAEK